MTVIPYFRPLISIHSTDYEGGPHIDYEDYQNLTLHEVENYGVTGSIQLINNLSDRTKNLLSSSCNLWSDGQARKMDRAMFLRVYKERRSTTYSIGVYLITEIAASDNILTLTFCDGTQYLRSIGSDFVRNYTQSSPTWTNHNTAWDGSNNYAYIECPDGFVPQGGLYGDVKFFKKTAQTITVDTTSESPELNNVGDYVEFNIMESSDFTLVKFPVRASSFDTYTIKAEVIIDGAVKWSENYTPELIITAYVVDKHITLSNFYSTKKATIKITVTGKGDKGKPVVIGKLGKHDGWETVVNSSGQRRISNYVSPGNYVQCISTTYVEGQKLETQPVRWKINSVNGEQLNADEYEFNWLGKASLYYVDPSSSVVTSDIFKQILQAVGFTGTHFELITRSINQFRCNGDFIHNYLLALADMPNSNGRQFAFRSSPSMWKVVSMGYRYKNTDTSQKSVKYSKNTGSGVDFLSFNPSISLKNRPRLAVAKGTDNNDKPIMVAIMDPKVPVGASVPSVNGSITTPVEGALATYSAVITNRSEDWQGEIVLSGIDLSFFITGSYVGGVPITINDNRYGFSNYRAKVKEVKLDFANQKTTITVNNYSEMYSNAILDTNKMAYSAGDMSAEASNVDMFCRQFINIDATDTTSSGDTSHVSFHVLSGTDGSVANASTIDFPELGIRIVNAYFPPGTGRAINQYGVVSVKVGNNTHYIPLARRPDKQENQSLIVNVIYRLN